MMKECTLCKIVKPFSEFGTYKPRNRDYRIPLPRCKKCLNGIAKERNKLPESKEKRREYLKSNKELRNKYHREWRLLNPDKEKAYRYKNRYKIEPGLIQEIINNQNQKCRICNTILTNKTGVCVDHNHTTGVVRGVLCRLCNIGLGGFKDNQTLLINAINYLKTNEQYY